VTIQSTKKLDKMFWLLLEQNQDVQSHINSYKDKYAKAQAEEVVIHTNHKKHAPGHSITLENVDKLMGDG